MLRGTPNSEVGSVSQETSMRNFETNQRQSTLMMKPDSSNQADSLAWVFSDKAGLRQHLLQQLGLRTVHFHHDLHSRAQCQRLVNEMFHQCPLVLWIRFAGPCAGSGNRHDAVRAENLTRIIRNQCQAKRYVVIEASERSQVWNLQAVTECMRELLSTNHQWCNYEPELRAGQNPCCSRIRLLTNFHVLQGGHCQCGSNREHVHQKDLNKSEAADRFTGVLRCLIAIVLNSGRRVEASTSQMPTEGQPESRPLDVNLNQDGTRKTVRFSSLHASSPEQNVVTPHSPPSLQSLPKRTNNFQHNKPFQHSDKPLPLSQHQQRCERPIVSLTKSLYPQDTVEDFWMHNGINVTRVHQDSIV